jgi:hypothetical protein
MDATSINDFFVKNNFNVSHNNSVSEVTGRRLEEAGIFIYATGSGAHPGS